MRDRLIELLKKAPLCGKDFDLQYSDGTIEKFADYLLANGVIVPPVKVGDTVYATPLSNYELDDITEMVVDFAVIGVCRNWVSCVWQEKFAHFQFIFDDFGKTVFLTLKEAEQALKGGEG